MPKTEVSRVSPLKRLASASKVLANHPTSIAPIQSPQTGNLATLITCPSWSVVAHCGEIVQPSVLISDERVGSWGVLHREVHPSKVGQL